MQVFDQCRQIEALVFSYIGYQTQEIEIGNKSVINVVLRENSRIRRCCNCWIRSPKKVSVTGAISTVPIKNLISVPVVTLDNALAGHLQGVVTKLTSGQPGTDATIRIRGIGTWTNANPLVLVDGIERSINLVNPQDVESISVLKDATATAVYGVRGANGVILITTKRGKAGKTQVTYRTEYAERIGTRFPQIYRRMGICILNERSIHE